MAKILLICFVCFTFDACKSDEEADQLIKAMRNKMIKVQDVEIETTYATEIEYELVTDNTGTPGIIGVPVTSTPPTISTQNTTVTNIQFTRETTEPPTTSLDCQQCPNIYDPVCASNNKSYHNECKMQCNDEGQNLTVLYLGKCLPF